MTNLATITDHRWFDRAIYGLILLNAAVLAAETMASGTTLTILKIIDKTCLVLFVVELALRMTVEVQRQGQVGLGLRVFFSKGWHVFDALAVLIALVPGLGALRTLRVLRLLAQVPAFKDVVEDLLHACHKASALLALTLILMFLGALTCTLAFQAELPDKFGTLGISLITVFGLTLADEVRETLMAIAEVHSLWAFGIGAYVLTMAVLIISLVVSIVIEVTQERMREKRTTTNDSA